MENNESLGGIFDFTFTKFVTPVVIKILYILVLVFGGLIWIFALIGAFVGLFNDQGVGPLFFVLVFGTLGLLMSILFYRIMFELVMVIFAIKENTDRLP